MVAMPFARLKVEILEKAVNSHDVDVVSKAQKMAIGGAIGVLVLIILLLVFLG